METTSDLIVHEHRLEPGEVVGWLAYDAEAHDLCRRMNQESLYFTRLAGDKIVELLTLQNSSMHAAAEGRPRGKRSRLPRSVLEGDYKLSPRIKALFLTRKARALAQSRDESALRLMPQIRDLYLNGVSESDPAWAWWIDDRELAWHEAMVHRDPGLVSEAMDHFERSVMATPADEIGSQYLHRAYLLQSQVDSCCGSLLYWFNGAPSTRQAEAREYSRDEHRERTSRECRVIAARGVGDSRQMDRTMRLNAREMGMKVA